MWYHWIDTEQPAWAVQELKDRGRRAWASFYEAEREEKEAEERKIALAARCKDRYGHLEGVVNRCYSIFDSFSI